MGEAEHAVGRLHDEPTDGISVEFGAPVRVLQLLHLGNRVVGVLEDLEGDARGFVLVVGDPGLDSRQDGRLHFHVGLHQRRELCQRPLEPGACSRSAGPLGAGDVPPRFVQRRQRLSQLPVLPDSWQSAQRLRKPFEDGPRATSSVT